MGAVNAGRLASLEQDQAQGIPWGLRQVQPLVEVRIPFFLELMELDNIARGSLDPDLTALEEAARKIAIFEERAIYNGFPGGQIKGLLESVSNKPVDLDKSAENYARNVGEAVKTLKLVGVDGPYALVLGTRAYHALYEVTKGHYPPYRIIHDLIGGEILWSPALDGGVVLSTRGGDFEVTVGQDMSIGYWDHDRKKVEFYITESFTFRVLEPAAAVELKHGA
jgi:uncharacterized linocin/CFP29 family protein